MTEKDRKEYILYRIETARNTLDAAKVLAENGFWNSVVNRLYYAAFYDVNSLLVKNEIYTKSHSGVRDNFHFFSLNQGSWTKSMEGYLPNSTSGGKEGIMKI